MQVKSGEIGFDLLFSNEASTLRTAAEAYFYLGWSVIPLYGDLDSSRPKIPNIPWTIHQHYRASLNDQRQWTNVGGLGIVTGRVSQLIVLDFDDEEVFKRFKIHYPDLLETHTVRSAGRQLPHLYFKLPDHLHFDSQKGQGIDLLSNGRYVVAPPTTINGRSYTIIRGGMPKTLTDRDIRRIQTFLATCTTDQTKQAKSVLKSTIATALIPGKPLKATDQDLANIYTNSCKQGGRNEALFRTSLFARDTGWSQTETQTSLVQLHVHQSTHSENPAQRQREALATIRSAFSRPAQHQRSARQTVKGHLPNSVREALMQQKMTYVIRTIEGLLMVGFKAGQIIRTQQAIRALKGLVGRDSIYNALQVTCGQALFRRVSPVSPLLTANAVARSKRRLDNKKCFLLPAKDQEKPHGGRPEHAYRIPSIAELCALLGVKLSNSDPLERADLATAHQTRMALHRELIKRRPGKYSRRWLAHRLGVTIPTISTYNRDIPIHSRSTYLETTIRWGNIERLPLDEPMRGAVLITTNGKKYPALRTIASMLLAKGNGVNLSEQGSNIYWYGDAEPDATLVAEIQKQQVQRQQAMEIFLVPNLTKPHSAQVQKYSKPMPKPKQGKAVPKSHTNFHKPLSDSGQETLAQQVYTAINEMGGKTLSLANARRITLMKSEHHLEMALKLIQKRHTLQNPTGFLITLLRSKYTAMQS